MKSTAWIARLTALIVLLSVSARAFTLTWINNDPFGIVTGWVIQRASDPAFTTNLTTFSVGNPAQTQYIDTAVSAGAAYYYRVAATTSLGAQFQSDYTNVVTNAPTIVTQPAATQTIPALASATFTVVASGIPAPSYQWRVNGTPLVDGGNVSGSNLATLTLATIHSTDTAVYDVVVSNGIPSAVTSTPSQLNVTLAPQTITFGALAPVTYAPNTTFNLTATASSGLTVSYASSNPSVATVSGSTVTVNGGGTTTITATQTGNTTYAAATPVQQVLTVNPGSQSITFGALASVTFSPTGTVTLAGTDSAGLTITYVSSNPGVVSVSGNTLTVVGAGTATITASQTGNASYTAAVPVQQTITVAKAAQTITFNPLPVFVNSDPPYTMTATASSGLPVGYSSSNSNVAYFTGPVTLVPGVAGGTATITASQAGNANYLPATSVVQTVQVNTPPAFFSHPQSTTTNVNQFPSFSVVVSGIPAPTFKWQTSLDGGSTWTDLSDTGIYSGTTTSHLQLSVVPGSQNGAQFRCVATNTVASVVSNAATLTVQTSPVIVTQPTNQFAAAASSATFTTAASGVPTPAFQWQVSTVPGGNQFTNLSNGGNYSGATTAVLTVSNVTTQMNGLVYRCIITNVVGSNATGNAVLTVGNVAPAFISNPTPVTVAAGTGTSFSVSASGGPAPTFQWKVSTNGGATFTALADGGSYSGTATATLLIASTPLALSGNLYECVASNAGGTATSTSALLTVTAVAPVFTLQPVSAGANIGANATFTVAASGAPAPSYQWSVSTDHGATYSPLADSGSVVGSGTASLTLNSVASGMNGYQYRCVATNSAGSATSSAATLTIGQVAPVITQQPNGSTVAIGGATSFTVAATGFPTPTYQWSVSTNGGSTFNPLADGGSYSGTGTATLAISGATIGLNNAQYRATATNSAGAVNSNAATLNVIATPPVITQQPVSVSVTAPAPATFATAATGNPLPTFQWQSSTDGGVSWANVSGGSNPTLTIATTSAGMSGTLYRCQVSNIGGVLLTNIATLTVSPAGGNNGGTPPAQGPTIAQNITFAPIASVAVGSSTSLVASASSGLPVTFAVVSGNGVISNGNQLLLSDSKPVTVQASQAGDQTFLAAPNVTRTVSALAPAAQEFFGGFGVKPSASAEGRVHNDVSASGSFAAVLGSNGSGTLIGYVSGANLGFVLNFTVTNGSFTGTTPAIVASGAPAQTLTFTGTVANGTISGSIAELGLTFSAPADPAAGGSANVAGYYPAGSLYSVVGSQNQVFVLTVLPTGVAAGTGTVTSGGSFSVQTSDGASVTGSIDASGGGVTGSVRSAEGIVTNFAGAPAGKAPTVAVSSPAPNAGATVTLSTPAVDGASYQWQYYGSNIAGATGATYALSNVAGFQGGVYTVVVTQNGKALSSNAATVTVNEAARLINFSARGTAGATSDQGLYAGFVVGGANSNRVLIRGVGPALAGFGVTGVLPSPSLTFYDSKSSPLATNSGWQNAVTPTGSGAVAVQSATSDLMASLGAFPLTSQDSAMVATTPAGLYSAGITGSGSAGVGLVEIYDLDSSTVHPAAYLNNISVRAPAGTGAKVLVAGFVVIGPTAQTVLIRGIGPTLAFYGIATPLAHPRLTLYDAATPPAVIAQNAGWGSSPTAGASAVSAGIQPATAALMSRVYAFTLPNGTADAAMVVTLPPGLYTAQLDSTDGATGIGLIEIYNLQ